MKRFIITIIVAVSMIFTMQAFSLNSFADDDYRPDPDSVSNYDLWTYINDINKRLENATNKVAEVGNNVNDIEGKTKKGVDSFFKDKITDEDSNELLDKNFTHKNGDNESQGLAQMLISMANDQWKRVGEALKKGGDLSGTSAFNKNFSIDTIKKSSVINVFKTFGYSLVLVFFSITLIESSIKYEIFTLKGGAMIFGRLLIAKTLIDKSVDICGWVLTAVTGLLSKMADSMDSDTFSVLPDVNIVASAKSKLWIVGPLVDLFISNIILLPVIIIALVTIVCAGMIVCKLVFRSFELAMLLLVSPAFFACASAEVTKPYFKNFVSTFVQCAIQIIFMAVVWVVVVTWQVDKMTFTNINDVGAYLWNVTPNLFILIAMTIIMVKPPKVLTGLLK